MVEFKIFTESPADVKFIRDYILEIFNVSLNDDDFDTLASWSGYKAGGGLIESIRRNHDNKKETILILDADNDFVNRKTEVSKDLERQNINFDLFLFPNNSSNGNLEILLTEIAKERSLIDCFRAYEGCVREYNPPLDKSRIYAYLDALLPKGEKNNPKNDPRLEKNRNYRDNRHWNLHHEYLKPLFAFFEPRFRNN